MKQARIPLAALTGLLAFSGCTAYTRESVRLAAEAGAKAAVDQAAAKIEAAIPQTPKGLATTGDLEVLTAILGAVVVVDRRFFHGRYLGRALTWLRGRNGNRKTTP